MADIEIAPATGSIGVTNDVDRADIAQKVLEFRTIGQLVDPFDINLKQASRVFGGRVQTIEINRLVPMDRTHPNELFLVADDINDFELLEHRGQRIEAFADLGPRLDRNAERWRIFEEEAQKRVADRAFSPVGDVEVEAGQTGKSYLSFFITGRKVVTTALLEITHSGEAYDVAVDRDPRHVSDFETPRAIMRRRDQDPPDDHGREDSREYLCRTSRPPDHESPDREKSECCGAPRARGTRRQIGEVDRQGSPQNEKTPAESQDCFFDRLEQSEHASQALSPDDCRMSERIGTLCMRVRTASTPRVK